MSRKRSVSSLFKDSDNEEESTLSQPRQPSQSRRNRSISSIINKEIVSSAGPSRNIRKREICNYSECHNKLVEARTKEIHDSRQQNNQSSQGTIMAQIQQ